MVMVMGDIILRHQVRISTGRPRSLRLYFDTGASMTLVKDSVANSLGRPFKLPKARVFGGLGNGRFSSLALMELEFHFLDIWCPHVVYVLADDVLEDRYDILVGHDLMQKYDIRPIPRRHDVLIDRSALRMALRIHQTRP